jgi:excisionase family DNA binding protein
VLKNDLLIGARAAADYTGLTERSIYHMVEKKKIPYRRVGMRIFFRRSELDIHFSSGYIDPTLSANNDVGPP